MTQDSVNVAQLQEFDEIVDVRSPSEFKLDHVPGAINCPVLDDEERARVGTIHAQNSAFTAKKVGAALVARNIAKHIDVVFASRPKTWRPLIYCWRGGQRSASMTIVLRQIGWGARKLAGGYKAYRRHVVAEIDRLVPQISFRVLCGLTGSGKSAVLRALEQRNAQVLDLEKMAAHRGSVLGNLPDGMQPSQKCSRAASGMHYADSACLNPCMSKPKAAELGLCASPIHSSARCGDRRASCLAQQLRHA